MSKSGGTVKTTHKGLKRLGAFLLAAALVVTGVGVDLSSLTTKAAFSDTGFYLSSGSSIAATMQNNLGTDATLTSAYFVAQTEDSSDIITGTASIYYNSTGSPVSGIHMGDVPITTVNNDGSTTRVDLSASGVGVANRDSVTVVIRLDNSSLNDILIWTDTGYSSYSYGGTWYNYGAALLKIEDLNSGGGGTTPDATIDPASLPSNVNLAAGAGHTYQLTPKSNMPSKVPTYSVTGGTSATVNPSTGLITAGNDSGVTTISVGGTGFTTPYPLVNVNVISAVFTAGTNTFEYSGSSFVPELTVKCGIDTLNQRYIASSTEDGYYATASGAGLGAGTVTITGTGKYAGYTDTLGYTITRKDVSSFNSGSVSNPIFTINTSTNAISSGQFTYGGATYIYGQDFNATARRVGKYSGGYLYNISITGIGNLTGSNTNLITNYQQSSSTTVSIDDVYEIRLNRDETFWTNGSTKTAVYPVITDKASGQIIPSSEYGAEGITVTYTPDAATGPGEVKVTVSSSVYDDKAIELSYKVKMNISSVGGVIVLDKDVWAHTGADIEPEVVSVTLNDTARTVLNKEDYIVSYISNTSVGHGTVRITGAPESSYVGTITKAFEIVPNLRESAQVSISPSSTRYGYDTVAGGVVSDLIKDYTGSLITVDKSDISVYVNGIQLDPNWYEIKDYGTNIDAGPRTGRVTIATKPEYYGEQELDIFFGIRSRTLTDANIIHVTPTGGTAEQEAADMTYTGRPIVLDDEAGNPKYYKVEVGGVTLTKGDDYTVDYENNTDVGNPLATLIVTGRGNYNGVARYEYVINPYDIRNSDVDVEIVGSSFNSTYTGEGIEPQVNMYFKGQPLVLNKDYKVSYSNNVNVGENTAIARVTGIGNFTYSKNATFSITTKRLRSDSISFQLGGWSGTYNDARDKGKMVTTHTVKYNGNPRNPHLVVYDNGRELTQHVDYEVEPVNNIKAAGASDTNAPTLRITGKGNYDTATDNTIDLTFGIAFRSLKDAEQEGNLNIDKTAGGTDGTTGLALPVIKDKSRTLKRDQDYELTYIDSEGNPVTEDVSGKAGKYTVEIKGKGNYIDTVTYDLVSGVDVSTLHIYWMNQLTDNGGGASANLETWSAATVKNIDYVGEESWNGDLGNKPDYENFKGSRPVVRIRSTGGDYSETDDITDQFNITYDLVSGNDFNAGSRVNVNITGKDPTQYYGKATRSYTVNKRNISDTDARAADFKISFLGQSVAPGGTLTLTVDGVEHSATSEMKIEYDPINRYAGDKKGSGTIQMLSAPQDVTAQFYVASGSLDLRTSTGTGTRQLTITANPSMNFTGSWTIKYKVVPKSINDTTISPDPIPTQYYTGESIKPDITVTYKDGTVLGSDDCTITYDTNTAEGVKAGKITITGKGEYDGTKEIFFDIERRSIATATVTTNPPLTGTAVEMYYTGAAQAPDIVSVSLAGKNLNSPADYTVTYSSGTKPSAKGSYTMTLTGAGIYGGTYEIPFNIGVKSLSDSDVSATLSETSFTYDGNPQTPTVTVKVGSETVDPGEYTVSYTSNGSAVASPQNPGTYNVVITGKGTNFSGTYSKPLSFTITAKVSDLTISNIADGDTLRIEGKGPSKKVVNTLYTGQNFDDAITVKFGSETLVKGKDYTVTPDNTGITNPRSVQTVTIKGMGVYSGSQDYTVKVHALMSDVDVAFEGNQSMDGDKAIYDFNNANITPRIRLSYNGAALNSNDYKLNYKASNKAEAGLDREIEIDGDETGLSGLYKGQALVLYHVLYNLRNAIISGVTDREYIAGTPWTPTPTVKDPSGVVLSTLTPVPYTPKYSGPDSSFINVGEYTLELAPNTNYSYNSPSPVTYRIGQKTLSNIEVRPSVASVIYKGKEWEPSFDVWDNDKNAKVDDSNIANVEYRNNIDQGTATIHVTLGGNYNGTATGTFVINPKPLSHTTISVQIDPCEYAGGDYVMPRIFVRDSDREVALSSSEIALDYHNNQYAASASDPTAAPYVIITAMSPNYTGTRTEKFTISKLNIGTGTLAGGGGSKVYNGELQKPDETGLKVSVTTATGNVVILTEADLDVTCSGGKNVGSYPVTYTAKTGNKNVEGTLPGFFEITPKPITDNTVNYSVKSTPDKDLRPSQAQIDFYKADLNNGLEISNLEVWDEAAAINKTLVYGTDYTYEYLNNKKASNEMQLIIRGMGNYATDPALIKKFSYGTNIAGSSDVNATVVGSGSFVFNGRSQVPEISVTYKNAPMDPDDYEIGWNPDDTVNAGYKALQITGSGKEYYGTKKFDNFYQITKVQSTSYIRVTPVLPYVSGAYTAEYTGKAILPELIVRDIQNDRILDPSEYTVGYGPNKSVGKNAGEYTVSFNSSQNYQGNPVKGYFNIVAKDIPEGTIQIRYFPEEQEYYTGSPIVKDVMVSDTSSGTPQPLTPSLDGVTGDFVVDYNNTNIKPGLVSATVKGINNYKFTQPLTFTIVADISDKEIAKITVPSGQAGQPYDKSQVTVRLKGQTDNVDPSYYQVEVNPITGDWSTSTQAIITVQGVGEYYTGTYTETFYLDKGIDPGPDPGPPTPPDDPESDLKVRGLNAAGTGYTTIGVVWAQKPDTEVDEYEIEWSIDGVIIDNDFVANPANSYTILDLDPATTYTIRMRAFDLLGNPGDWCAPVTATTYGTSPTPPVPGTKDIAGLTGSISDKAYTGSQIRPLASEITIEDGNYTLVAGTDFSVVASGYGPNIEKGTGAGTVTVRGRGNYTGTKVIPFNITDGSGPTPPGPGPTPGEDKPFSSSDIRVELEYYSTPYTGTQRTPRVTVYDGTLELNRNQDYRVSYGQNISGTGTVTVTAVSGSGYTGSKTVTFAITGGYTPTQTLSVNASAIGTTGASVSWNAIVGTNLYQVTYSNGYSSQIRNVYTPYITLDGLTPGTTYTISVTAYSGTGSYIATGSTRLTLGSSGTGGGGTSGGGTGGGGTSGSGTMVTPSIISSTGSYAGTNVISFTAQGNNVGYEIYRSTNSGVVGSRIAFTPRYSTPTTVNHKDNQNLVRGTTYYYRVRPFTIVNGSTVYGQYSAPLAIRAL